MVAGCNTYTPPPPPKTVQVSGKITLASGVPITAGRVVFKPQTAGMQEAIGEINPDGTYSLTSYNKGDGAVPGTYIVTFDNTSYKTGKPVVVRLNVPLKYYSDKTSDVLVNISEAGDYPINLR